MKGAIYIGTSGWNYKHWRGRFYPKEIKAADYLAFYAQDHRAVEINSSFYHLPKPTTVAHWVEQTPASFRFCPKISRYITHMKKLNDPEETLPAFFKVFDRIKKRLGPVLIQLPPRLAFHEERATGFYRQLKRYKGYRFALEARHESWYGDQSVALLKKNQIARVIAESGGRWPSSERITSGTIYIRFHGPHGYGSSYPDDWLRRYLRKIKKWYDAGHSIWIFFNNDGHAYAIRNAALLIHLAEKTKG